MNIYCKVGISEYWIVDWRKKLVEIYLFDWKEDENQPEGISYPYLFKSVTEKNKEDFFLNDNLYKTFEGEDLCFPF